nr:FtsK/SpoIIIE domain-containing protein [uncultured Ruminococcus sp.]
MAVICSFAVFLIWINRKAIFNCDAPHPGLQNNKTSSLLFFYVVGMILYFAMMMVLFGMPKHAKRYHDNFQRAGMVNSAMEAPALLERTYDADNPKIQRLVFFCKGLPVSVWNDNKEKIQSALNISIDRVEQGSNNQLIVVYAIDGSYQLPDMIEWSDKILSSDGFTLVLGESIASAVEVDLSKVPHILLGGSTGSGKTLLLKLLLMQCILKGAEVYIADFKGGVDFNRSWKTHAQIITEPDELSKCLDELVEELHRRKRLLVDSDCANIDEYNRRYHQQMPRIIFGCDEVAELLDKTGLGKNDREQVQRFEAALATLVRLGRAMGIHCILATQRPDAQVISGQIKNNIDFRVCGRADDVLSQIILDKTDANDLISKTAQGRFLTNTDVLFQAYYFDDKSDW